MGTFDNYGPVLFALCVWREARNQIDIARVGVANVIRNRANSNHEGFPNTILEVILQKDAFSSFNATDPESHVIPDPKDIADWAAFQHCCFTIDNLSLADPTKGAVFYESEPEDQLAAVRARDPWFAADKLTVQLGAIRFYRA